MADKALDFGLARLCFNGPEEELRKTFNTQPAVLLVSYAAWAVLNKEMKVKPYLLAGHSLGEYTALLAAGLFFLKEALRLTRQRGLRHGRGMLRKGWAAWRPSWVPTGRKWKMPAAPYRMCSSQARRTSILRTNSSYPGISTPLKEVVDRLKGDGYKKAVFLNVPGPFHSPLMRPAAEKLKSELDGCVFSPMKVPVVSNVDAVPNIDSEKEQDLLYRQMFSPVRWEESVRTMASQGVEVFLEVGPGKVLTKLLKRIIPDIPCYHVETMEEIQAVRGVLS